jgi:hypothetical protein
MAALLNLLISLFFPRNQRDLAPVFETKADKLRRQRSLRQGNLADAGDD